MKTYKPDNWAYQIYLIVLVVQHYFRDLYIYPAYLYAKVPPVHIISKEEVACCRGWPSDFK